jgi:four helix bundle protein
MGKGNPKGTLSHTDSERLRMCNQHMARHYKDLVAWQKAMLVSQIYLLSSRFPKHELYSLTNQIRRAAVSVPSNIAEGQAHFSKREFAHFLRHARGSLAEVETQIIIAQSLGYTPDGQADGILDSIDELNRVLAGLLNSLENAA